MIKVKVEDSEYLGKHVVYRCPGCGMEHRIPFEKPQTNKAIWGFNGDVEAPTLTPSINARTGPFPDGHIDICHHFVRNGQIEFCPDSNHHLSSKTVNMLESE